MFGRFRYFRWLFAVVLLTAAEGTVLAIFSVALTAPAQAQWWGNNDGYYQRRQRPQRSGGFFEDWFGPREPRPYYGGGEYERPVQPHITHQPSGDSGGSSRAPAPRKTDKDAPAPTTSIVVLGDAMADWLAYGLEDAFADAPEFGIVRKNRLASGLIRYDAKGDLDWWHVARELLATEKPSYVVMMLGINDRQNIRERDLAKEAEKKAKDQQDKTDAAKKDADKKDGDKKDANKPAEQDAAKKDTADELDGVVGPETSRGKSANGVLEFRTEQWAQVYSRRIDDTIAALKSKGVPVFWVGLPALRGPKSTADMVYLNDLYRARAEKAGAIYIDVWDGFVDEGGKFTTFGPDFEGQNRRLRTADGVFFTKYGARKLAHYVEREIRRTMNNRGPIALPMGPVGPLPSDNKPTARPLAGPVVPLTVTPANSDALLGTAGAGGSAHGDALASQVLVRGEPVAAPYGRADDFVWPRGSDATRPAPNAANASPPSEASSSAPAIAQPEPSAAAAVKPAEARPTPKAEPAARTAQTVKPKPRVAHRSEARQPPRPPAPVVRRSTGPFDFFR